MRRLFLLLVPFLTAAQPAMSVEASIHEKCLKAADYKGCVEVMGGASLSSVSPIQGLVDELKVLSSRLESVSLSTLSERSTAFRDALSLIDASSLKDDYEKSIHQGAEIVDNMISALASAWQARIYDATKYTSGTQYISPSKYYLCRYLESGVSSFNYAAPVEYSVTYNGYVEKTWVGDMDRCSPQEWEMIDSIQQYIAELTIDPKAKAKQVAEEKRRLELCQLEPWERYLEENPSMKAWVTANPALAEQRKKKFFEKPENKTNCDNDQTGRFPMNIWGSR